MEQFAPGDVIKFKRGEIWNLTYNNFVDFHPESGTPENYITIMDYGKGPKPTINALEDVSVGDWFNEEGNIWFQNGIEGAVRRCWLNGVESVEAANQDSIDGITRLWYHNDNVLYVYSEQPPNDVEIARISFVVRFRGSSYIIIQNLTLIGGKYANIVIQNSCHNIQILNNTLLRSGGNGVQGSTDIGAGYVISDVLVEGNFIDGELSLIDYNVYSTEGVNANGVGLYYACVNWIVRHNIVRDFSHDLISLYAWNPVDVGNHNNIIEDNILLGGNSHYIRGFGISATEGKGTNNIFRNNIIKDCNVRTQPTGNNNQIHGNIFHNIKETLATNKNNVSEGIQLAGWFTDYEYICHDNEISNNIFFGVFNEGISIISHYPYNNIIRDNIVIDTGRGGDNLDITVYVDSQVTGANTIKNNFLYDNDTDKSIKYKGFLYTVEEANSDLPDFVDNRTACYGMCWVITFPVALSTTSNWALRGTP